MNTDIKIARSAFKADMKLVAEFTKQYKKAFKEGQRTGSYTQLRSVVEAWQKSSCCVETLKNRSLERCHWHELVACVINDVRHLHVAYSLLNGRTLDQVEKTEKKLNEDAVKAHILRYASQDIADSVDLSINKSIFTRMINTIKEVCQV